MFAGPNGTLMAAWAAAPAKPPRGRARRPREPRPDRPHPPRGGAVAASGWSALALDLLSEEGGTGAFPGEGEVAAKLAEIPPERFDADMRAALTGLQRGVAGGGLAAVGFCFGAGMVWRWRPASTTRSWSSPRPTTPSSTTRASDSSRPPRRRPGGARCAGSTASRLRRERGSGRRRRGPPARRTPQKICAGPTQVAGIMTSATVEADKG
jgi:hypothetical protein